MTAPGGPCEWCGGHQKWCIHNGEMYVRCIAGCQSLFASERVDIPPPDSEWLEELERSGTSGGREGRDTCEGADAKEVDEKYVDRGLPF